MTESMIYLRPRGHYRGTLVQLLIVNVAMILMDAAIIGVQYSGPRAEIQ
jgi:hypothetical protein